MTRYSRYLWAVTRQRSSRGGTNLQVSSPEEFVERMVYRLKTADGYELIVHLVRMPTTKKWDVEWLDEPKLLANATLSLGVGAATLRRCVGPAALRLRRGPATAANGSRCTRRSWKGLRQGAAVSLSHDGGLPGEKCDRQVEAENRRTMTRPTRFLRQESLSKH